MISVAFVISKRFSALVTIHDLSCRTKSGSITDTNVFASMFANLLVARITELAVVGLAQIANNGHNAVKMIVMLDNFTPCLYFSHRKQKTSMLLMHFDDILGIQNLLQLLVLFYTTCCLWIYIGFGTQCHGSVMLNASGLLPLFVF